MKNTNPIPYVNCKIAADLYHVLKIKNLRNTSYQFMTNHQKRISLAGQIIWYFRYYRSAHKSGKYRVYLFYDSNNNLVGYGALRREDRLCITECVDPNFRRHGYGKAILMELINIGKSERQNLLAEIWADNKISSSMHEKFGFKLIQASMHNGRKLNTYLLDTVKTTCENHPDQK